MLAQPHAALTILQGERTDPNGQLPDNPSRGPSVVNTTRDGNSHVPETENKTYESTQTKPVGKALGMTPFSMNLDRKLGTSVLFSKQGYKTVLVPMTVSMSGWVWGNILIGGFLGITTDSASGAVNEYTPNHIFVTLVPENSTPIENGTMQSHKDQMKAFIAARYESILSDIHIGTGEGHNRTHHHPEGERERANKGAASGPIEKYQERVDFADHVIAGN